MYKKNVISIECFKGLPLEFESFLINRYNSFMITCGYFEIYYSTYEINYMLVYEKTNLIDLLIFGNKGDCSTCFNSFVVIDQNIISECTKYLFINYPLIRKIMIAHSYSNYELDKTFLISKTSDHILNLPLSIDDYYLELGNKTRRHLKNYKVRLLKEYPGVNFITKFGEDIDKNIVQKIVQLNIERMRHKGIIPGKDMNDMNNIYRYSQCYGCIAYLEINGEIIAGSISTILNKKIFLQVIAHDDLYSRYDVGQICILYLIQTSINRKLSALHLLWGDNEYKLRLLAKPQFLYSYFTYRSYSFDYVFSKVKTNLHRVLLDIRQSNITKPIRDTIKSYRSRSWRNR